MHSRGKVLPVLFWLLLLVAAPVGARNVLLLIADDYGIDSAHLYNATPGATLPPTPNIDSLKTGGNDDISRVE